MTAKEIPPVRQEDMRDIVLDREAYEVRRRFIEETEGKSKDEVKYDPVARRAYLQSHWWGRLWLAVVAWFKN